MVVALDRRTGTAPYSLSQLSYSEDLCEEAFIDTGDMLCVPRQISTLLNLDFGLVCNELTELERKLYGVETWTEKSATPRMVIEFAKGRKLGACILHNGNVLETLPGNNRSLVAALHGNHLYSYSGRARTKLMNWKTNDPRKDGTKTKIRREHQENATSTPAQEWLPFKYEVEPGHYYTTEEQMAVIRAWFL